MNRVRGQIILVVTDTLLAYCIEMLKLHTKLMVNNEFALNFANHFEISPFYLYGMAILALIAAGIADSLSCKFYPIVVGLIAGLLSSICAVVQLWLDSSSDFLNTLLNEQTKTFLLVYVSTSAIRDMFVIEQIKFPNPHQVHRYIFLLVYPRIIVKGLSRIVYEFMDTTALKINFTVILVVYLLYFILFTFGLIMFFYIEPIYYNMWYHGLMCVVYSFKNKEGKSFRKSRLSLDSSFKLLAKTSFDTYNMNMHTPGITRKFFGFKAITTEQPESQIIEKSPTPSPEEEKRVRFWLGKIVTAEKAEEEDSKDSQEVRDEMIYMTHWLHQSSPKSTQFVIIQTARFFEVLSIIIAGSFFSWMDYFLSAITYLQTFLSKRNTKSIFDSIDPPHLAFGFDVILFPLFYFLMFPLFCRIFRRDVRFIYFGYLLVLIANVVMLCIQAKAVIGQGYVPGPTSGQVRIYNSLNTNISISPLWGKRTFQIQPRDQYVITDIHLQSSSSERQIKIENDELNMTITSNATILEYATTCYVVSSYDKNLLFVQIKDKDITAFGKKRQSLVPYVIVSSQLDLSTVQVVFSERTDENIRKIVYQRLSEPGTRHGIEPGEYNILIRYGASNEYGYSLPKPALMEKWGVYSLFFYTANGKSIEAQHFHLEGPPGIHYTLLYIHLFIASLGRAFATVPFYMFLYLESPEKLRSTVISLVLFFNLIWLAVFNSRFIAENCHGKHMTFMVIFVFAHGVLLLVLYYTSKFRHRHTAYSNKYF